MSEIVNLVDVRKRTTAATAPPTDQPLRVVVVGHVDHGKSTLIGRLMHDTGSLFDGKYEQLVAAAARRGVPFEFANLMDAFQAERDQNVTIDTAQIWFKTTKRRCVLIDAPGHKEFLRNMVTGAASADAALVIIDAHEGVLEQSRRHGYLLKLLGVEQIAVIVNKMDLVGYSSDVFRRVADEYVGFLTSIGLSPSAVVPISARAGDNVAAPSPNMPWHTGGSIVDVLDGFVPPAPDASRALRMPIQDIYRFDHRRILAGRVESGTVRVGDRLVFLPSGKQSTVKTIERWNAPPPTEATVGESIGLTLTEQLFLDRGEIAAALHDAPSLTSEFVARVFWLGRRPLVTGRRYTFKLVTQQFEGEVTRFANVVDASTLSVVGAELAPPDACASGIGPDMVADVTIASRTPIVADPYDRAPATGRFVIVDELEVSGGGIVLDVRDAHGVAAPVSANLVRSMGQVSREERHLRNRHIGAVVWFTGLSGSGKSTLANALERELFNQGKQAFVLDGDNIRFGLSADLVFSASDRAENIRRVAEAAKLFAEAGFVAITAFISPYRSDRARARQIMQREGLHVPFLEVFLSTPIEVCEARDPKRLYARARVGEIKEFTGISAPFEPPVKPDVIIDTSQLSIDQSMIVVLDHVAHHIDTRRSSVLSRGRHQQ